MTTSRISINWLLIPIAFVAGLLAAASVTNGQVTPEEHAKHHPGQAQEQPANAEQGSGTKNESESGKGGMMGGGEGGGMGGMMGSMMEKMGAPKPKEMYPKLMDFPDMTAEQQSQFQEEAHARMIAGTALLSEGLDRLTTAAPTDDFATMQEATAKMREGLAQFESGLAAHRAIAEGKSPRNVATQWFKREMNLMPPATTASTGFSLFGMGLFHSLVMLLLILFTAAMLWMYFFKMRRATSLLEKLTVEPASSTGIDHAKTIADDGKSTTSATIENETPSRSPTVNDKAQESCCDGPAMSCGDTCDSTAEDGDPTNLSQGLLAVAKRKLCKLRVAKIFQETDDVKTFRLVACHGGGIPFSYLPGQFLTLTLPVGKKPIRRSYTIASAPTQGYYCEITVKREDKGAGSRFLHDSINEGDTLEVQAPSGKFVFTGKEAEDIVLISGGVGITPMMSITRALTDMGWQGQIFFVVACRDIEHFIFESELQQLQQLHSNLHVFGALSQIKQATDDYRVGRLNKEMLVDWIPEIASKRVHICGPVPMMDAMKSLMSEMGVASENIHTENFGSAAKPKKVSPKTKTKSKAANKKNGKPIVTVEFKSSGKSTSIEPDETLLEAAERIGVDIDNSCRVGMCGVCAVKIIAGEAPMDIDDGLDPDDRAAGKVLACRAKCSKDVVVEA